MAATGGGKQTTETLTSEEEQVLNLMCSTSIHSHPVKLVLGIVASLAFGPPGGQSYVRGARFYA